MTIPRCSLLTTACCVAFVALRAGAQSAQASDPGAAREKTQGLEEIIVSGDRRDRNLQDVGAAVSSFSGRDLLERGLRNFNTLQYQVPSLFSGGGLTKITLRGVGSEIVGPGVDPGFAVHVNGVFSARETTGTLDYFDIERVDVLRGPQGMLWGRNSTGGALNVITNRPTSEFGASLDFEYGRFDDAILRGAINLPLVEDELYSRVAFIGHFSEGYMEISSGGNHEFLNDDRSGSVRASLRWEPSDDITLDLIGSYQEFDNDGPGIKSAGPYQTQDPVFQGDGFDRGLDYGGALPNPSSPYKGTADEPQYQDAKAWTATLIAQWLLEGWKLTSTSGFQQTDYFLHRDEDTSSLPIQILELTDKSHQLSQEFLFQSDSDGLFQWTLGANYQWDKTPRTRFEITDAQNTAASVDFVLEPFLGPPFLNDVLSLVDGCPPACPDSKPLLTPQEDFVDADASTENHVAGVFTLLSYEVLQNLTLSAGARFSYTHRRWKDDSLVQSFLAIQPVGTFDLGLLIRQVGVYQRDDWKAVTWKVGVDHNLGENHLLWVSVGTGERAGGFNFLEEQSFDEERILAWEAGTKSLFFGERLRVNLTAFGYDWDDPQVSQRVDGVDTVVNVPSAISYGVEAEIEALVGEAMLVYASLGWLEAHYDKKLLAADSTVVDFSTVPPRERVVDLDGKRVPRSPRFTVALGAQYEFALGALGSITPRVDFYYRDRISFRQFGNPKDEQESFTRTDVRLKWESADRRCWIEVFARNLENEAVVANQEIHNGIDRVRYYDPPINAGFRLGFEY